MRTELSPTFRGVGARGESTKDKGKYNAKYYAKGELGRGKNRKPREESWLKYDSYRDLGCC